MGVGMAKFIEKEVETCKEFDEYCHYVAGLVGVGLSKVRPALPVCDSSNHTPPSREGLGPSKRCLLPPEESAQQPVPVYLQHQHA